MTMRTLDPGAWAFRQVGAYSELPPRIVRNATLDVPRMVLWHAYPHRYCFVIEAGMGTRPRGLRRTGDRPLDPRVRQIDRVPIRIRPIRCGEGVWGSHRCGRPVAPARDPHTHRIDVNEHSDNVDGDTAADVRRMISAARRPTRPIARPHQHRQRQHRQRQRPPATTTAAHRRRRSTRIPPVGGCAARCSWSPWPPPSAWSPSAARPPPPCPST